jgi:hypothetical protein
LKDEKLAEQMKLIVEANVSEPTLDEINVIEKDLKEYLEGAHLDEIVEMEVASVLAFESWQRYQSIDQWKVIKCKDDIVVSKTKEKQVISQ